MPSRPHRAEAGLLLCRQHLDELADDLVGIEDEMNDLDAAPSMQIVWGGKGGTLAREQVPIRIDAAVLGDTRYVRDADVRHPAGFDNGPLPVYGVLHYYADLVRDGRMLQRVTRTVVERIGGTGAGPFCLDCEHASCRRMRWTSRIPVTLTVKSERKLLTRHLEWCATQPWIDDMAIAVHRLHEQLQRVNGTAEAGPIPGRCPRLSDDARGECGGRLYPVKPKHTSGALVHIGSDEVVQAIECDRNANHHWEDKDLIRLAIILDQQSAEESA
jgi:hypothetical protein